MNEYGLKAPGSCGCPPEAPPTWSSASPDSPARQMDLSRTMFRAPLNVPVGEFLQAIPKVKGAPVISKLGIGGETTLYVEIQYAQLPAIFAVSPIYNNLALPDPAPVPTAALGPKQIYLARMGYYVPALKIDSTAVAWTAAGNPSANRLPAAVTSLCAWLDYYLARGGATPPEFLGLIARASDLGRLVTPGAPINPDVAAGLAVTAINPRDRGAGASADCFIANDRMVRSLMASTGGLTGSSGWRVDARTGLNVYHYAGLPVYRCNLPDYDENPELSYLFAANLGRDGVCLIHAYGTADTLGVQVDEEPAAPQQGQVRYVVHGAWTLMVFDPGALIGYANVNYTVG